MKITVDGLFANMQPDSMSWEPPRLLGVDGQGAPVRAPHWTCRLGFSRLTLVQYETWHDDWGDGVLHTITLPHPANGELTAYQCYVRDFTPRFDTRDTCIAAASGVDITLTRIQVV